MRFCVDNAPDSVVRTWLEPGASEALERLYSRMREAATEIPVRAALGNSVGYMDDRASRDPSFEDRREGCLGVMESYALGDL